MTARFSIRRFAVDRLTVILLALALAVLAVAPGGTAQIPCPDQAQTTIAPTGATIPPPVGLDPDEPRRPRRGIDLSLRVWNLRVEFPWMRALPVSPGHHIVISLFARGPAD
jgi:hypothetical protein